MQIIDASRSHPITPPRVGLPPAATNVGSDHVACTVHIEELERDPGTTLADSPVAAFLQNVLGAPPRVEALSHETFVHATSSEGLHTNMLLMAADLCFQAHLPLGLRPEVLWYTILSQLAAEVKSRPEAYRSLFASDQGTQKIVVRHDGLRLGSAYGWDQAIGMFQAPLGEHVPSSVLDACIPDDLSTCGTPENLASLIAFMDAASPYYEYSVLTLCGIPKVALFGTTRDWENLIARMDRVATFYPDLADYFASVRPLLAKIAKATTGERDTEFWKSLFKRKSESGGDKLTGWLSAFFLYLADHQGETARRTDFTWDQDGFGDGINPAAFPSSVSAVPFIWDYAGKEIPMRLCGGVLSNVDIGGFMTARLGWAVVHR
jgi:hypothetical protein